MSMKEKSMSMTGWCVNKWVGNTTTVHSEEHQIIYFSFQPLNVCNLENMIDYLCNGRP